MAETVVDVRGLAKPVAYEQLATLADELLKGVESDAVATMATLSSLVHHGFGHLWTGFYRLVGPELLRVGPYQGTLGCLEIRFGRGVCGTAARERRTVVVPDVEKFPGHITCDGRARSEIVVPVFGGTGGELLGVFDVDSEGLGTFDEDDARGLERLLRGRFGGES